MNIQTHVIYNVREVNVLGGGDPLLLTTVLQSKVKGRFRKILWPSQNI